MFWKLLIRRSVIILLAISVALLNGITSPVTTSSIAQDSEISLTADKMNITQGQCTTLHYFVPSGWSLVNIFGFTWQANGYSGGETMQESQEVCPVTTTTYTIYGVYSNGEKQASITITVSKQQPLIPPTSTPEIGNVDNDYSRLTLFLQKPRMNGPDVVYLQNRLLDLGYLLPIYGADGWFGEETDAAVREFQDRNGLLVDGMVGPITWEYLNNPNAVRGDLNYLPTNTPTKTSTPTPPEIRITNFTLANTLTDFSVIEMPTVLVPNALWVEVTNIGQTPFYSPEGGGQFVLQIVLKKPGGKLEEYTFVPGLPNTLEPLHNLEPGESQILLVKDLFFFTSVADAEMEIFFAPNPTMGLQNSILSKPVTVKEQTDSFQRCAGTVAQAMIKVAKTYFPEYNAALTITDLAVKTIKCGKDGDCVAKENAKWLSGLAFGSIGDSGKFLSLAGDALFAMGESPPCIKVTDWVNAYLHEAIRKNYKVNGIITESPVYPLITNEAGQRAGFLKDGSIIEEIPGSKVISLGEDRFVLYPGENSSQLSIFGYADGKMNLNVTLTQGLAVGTTIFYNDIVVINGMTASLTSVDSHYLLGIDENSDGTIEHSLIPNEILSITESGILQQPVESPTSTRPVDTSTPSQKPGGICAGPLGLLVLQMALIWKQKRRNIN